MEYAVVLPTDVSTEQARTEVSATPARPARALGPTRTPAGPRDSLLPAVAAIGAAAVIVVVAAMAFIGGSRGDDAPPTPSVPALAAMPSRTPPPNPTLAVPEPPPVVAVVADPCGDRASRLAAADALLDEGDREGARALLGEVDAECPGPDIARRIASIEAVPEDEPEVAIVVPTPAPTRSPTPTRQATPTPTRTATPLPATAEPPKRLPTVEPTATPEPTEPPTPTTERPTPPPSSTPIVRLQVRIASADCTSVSGSIVLGDEPVTDYTVSVSFQAPPPSGFHRDQATTGPNFHVDFPTRLPAGPSRVMVSAAKSGFNTAISEIVTVTC
jgi:hypothetical protein